MAWTITWRPGVSESKVLHLGDKPDALPESAGRQDRLPARTTEPQAGLFEGGASRTRQAPESPLSVLVLGYASILPLITITSLTSKVDAGAT